MTAPIRLRWLYAALERVAVFIVLAVLWEKAVDFFAIKPYLLPPLSSVLRSLWHNRAMIADQTLVPWPYDFSSKVNSTDSDVRDLHVQPSDDSAFPP